MMRDRKSRRAGPARPVRPGFWPSVEAFERRELLTTVAPFLQGTAFVDTVGNGVRTTTEAPLANATVSLYKGTTVSPASFVASTTTGSDGGYLFNSGLAVGTTYTLVESAAGYSNTNAQASSQVDPASVIAPNTIRVTVVDPNAVTASFNNPVSYGSPPYDRISYTLNGAANTIVPTQLTFTLGGASNVNTTPFPSLCVGINDRLDFNTPYAGVVDPQSALGANGGEIAYLYNHYGATLPNAASLPAGLQSISPKNLVAGVQLAIWELEYGSSFALTGYDANYTSAQDYADLQAAAAGFIADAAGKSEKVAIIDASLTGSLPAPSVTAGGQSVLAGESLNFGNAPLLGSIAGKVYVDATGVGLSTASNQPAGPGDTPESGVTVQLLSGPGGSVLASQVVGPSGAYLFSNLAPGNYFVQELVPAGYVQTGPNSLTYTVPLAPGQMVVNDNFSNYQATTPCQVTGISYTDVGANGTTRTFTSLGGNTHEGDKVTVTFTTTMVDTLTLVSYDATSNFDLTKQTIYADDTETFQPGQHSLTVTIPNNYYQIDFVCGGAISAFNPSAGITYHGENRFIDSDHGGDQLPGPSTLSGTVYVDANGNDVFGPGDSGLGGVTVNLSGTTLLGAGVTASTTTSSTGAYSFPGLATGLYTITEVQPGGYFAEKANVGSAGGSAAVGSVSAIALNSNTAGTGYNFGEIGTSITGTVYNDATGNGLSPAGAPLTGDTPESGVTIQLLNASNAVVATTTSAKDGTYSFIGVPVGNYTVAEVVPSGQIETGPASLTNPASISPASPTDANNNFSNDAACNTSAIINISYRVNGCGPYGDLSGHTSQGCTVSATFTVTGSASQMVTLVSYVIPNPSNPALAQQVEYSLDTGTFTTGTHTVSITLPCGYYQVDFVCGAAISQFGPAGSNVTYHGEKRFFSSDTGGWNVAAYCPPPLANVQGDVGSVGTPGTEAYKNGSYTITGGGADIWNNADAFNYVYQALDGDGEIVARVDSISYTDPWAKAGVMIRQSLDPGSPQASVFATPGNGVVFQDREAQGGSSNSWSAGNSYGCNSSTPVYVKLVRSGTTLSAYDSYNGINWQSIGSDTISMTQRVYIGLAVTSHNNGAVASATFDAVSTTGYWSSCAGQSLIQSFGGCPSSTGLSGFLAQTYPNLYGCNAGLDNLTGQDNNGVAAFAQALEAQYGAESLECLTLATALDEYATSSYLGGQTAHNWGFNTSCYGIAGESVNTTGACDAFGTSGSSPSTYVWYLLQAENDQAVGGVLYAGNSTRHQLACNVIYQVSSRGY